MRHPSVEAGVGRASARHCRAASLNACLFALGLIAGSAQVASAAQKFTCPAVALGEKFSEADFEQLRGLNLRRFSGLRPEEMGSSRMGKTLGFLALSIPDEVLVYSTGLDVGTSHIVAFALGKGRIKAYHCGVVTAI